MNREQNRETELAEPSLPALPDLAMNTKEATDPNNNLVKAVNLNEDNNDETVVCKAKITCSDAIKWLEDHLSIYLCVTGESQINIQNLV